MQVCVTGAFIEHNQHRSSHHRDGCSDITSIPGPRELGWTEKSLGNTESAVSVPKSAWSRVYQLCVSRYLTHTLAGMHAHTHTHTHTYTHARTHVCMHTYSSIYIYIHTYIHTYIQCIFLKVNILQKIRI